MAYGMGHQGAAAPAMKVAGKTGTAPAEEGAWTHAWFAGYAPAEEPEIVLVVFLEKGHGGSDAAAVARQVFDAFAEDSQQQGCASQRCATVRSFGHSRRCCSSLGHAVDAQPAPKALRKSDTRSGFPQTVRIRLWYLHPPRELTCAPRRAKRRFEVS